MTLPRPVALIALTGLALLLTASGATAVPAQADDAGYVAVVEVSGLLDEVLVDFVENQIAKAEEEDAVALVLQLNSSGAVVSDARLDRLIERIDGAEVPVDVWVGPSGSQASGDATALLAVARTVGVAPGSRVEITRTLLDEGTLAGQAAVGDKVSAGDAVDLGLVGNAAPILGEFVLDLDGVESKVVGEGDDRRRELVTQGRSAQLPLGGQLMHTVSSPPVAYLLFVIGLALVLFELFTAGVGVAGLVGAGSLVLGCYGLAALPTDPVGLGLILLAMVGFGIDVQTGVPRVWSGIATVAFTVGSVLIYDGLSLSWITLLVAIVGMTLAMLGGMPAMVRARFSTPTIGREWMVGEVGTSVGRVAPEGIVRVREAPWRARTNRVTPIDAGRPVRVVSIDGLLLEVEPSDAQPETGGGDASSP